MAPFPLFSLQPSVVWKQRCSINMPFWNHTHSTPQYLNIRLRSLQNHKQLQVSSSVTWPMICCSSTAGTKIITFFGFFHGSKTVHGFARQRDYPWCRKHDQVHTSTTHRTPQMSQTCNLGCMEYIQTTNPTTCFAASFLEFCSSWNSFLPS